jgi:hypothetical protein
MLINRWTDPAEQFRPDVRPKTATVRYLIQAVVISLATLISAGAATRVELVVDEPVAQRNVPWPVTTGVPFPRGGLKRMENCRLLDDTGRERPLQSRVTATWDEERTSIRWLTIDFIAQPGRKYALEFGPDVERTQFESLLHIDTGQTIRVATGALTAEFSESAAAALNKVRVDLNGDGTIAPDEIVAQGSPDGEHYYVDQQGRRFTSGQDGTDRQIVVESSGPVRACVRVDGFYTGEDGQRIVRYRTRHHFFAGLSLVKVVDEFKIVGSTKDIKFADIGFALELPVATQDRTVAVDAAGDDGNQTLTIPWRSATESISSFQSVYRHYGNPEYHAAVVEVDLQGERRLAQTDRMGEWMQVADARASVTGSLRWFWQQFPKEWEATPDRLVLHLWSPRGGMLDFSEDGIREFFGPQGRKYLLEAFDKPPTSILTRYMRNGTAEGLSRGGADGRGTNKHHEFFLHFAPPDQAQSARDYAALAARQPLALASGTWNVGTDVFGPLAARPNDSKYEAIVDKLFDLSRYAQDTFGDYGWWVFGSGPHYNYQWDATLRRHYADPMRFEYHTYQKETQLWWCYLRSGERKFYDWAIPSENHWVDIAVSHEPHRFESHWRGGEPEERTLDWPRGDWLVDGAAHYLRHHQTAEAWLRGGAQFWASYHRTLETTTLAYYLTGDERYNDVIEYWRAYFGDLGGKTSGSTDMQPWHRQQTWFRPSDPGAPAQTWAEMIREYAPFNSGSRHQQTLFFNLATLYEHTWDPRIKQALTDYADAFLDPQHPIGVWRSQDNQLPAKAEAPAMAHFWAPALWKYARATRDPRMPGIFRRYFAAGLAADPFREDVGRYSNVHIGYAYYFTRDPRHLRSAQRELEKLWPNAAPLTRPEDLRPRLFNPYAPIASLTATPRLIWALNEARRNEVEIPPPEPLGPQRTAITIEKSPGKPVAMKLWGYDRSPSLLGPDGREFTEATVLSTRAVSHLQPFDRITPGFEVFTHAVTIPADAPSGFYLLVPKLEIAILGLDAESTPLANAARPLAIEPGESWRVLLPPGVEDLVLESGQPSSLYVRGPAGDIPAAERTDLAARFSLDTDDHGAGFLIQNPGSRSIWFRITNWPEEHCWAWQGSASPKRRPGRELTLSALPSALEFNPDEQFVPGRFGEGVQIHAERQLHVPDHVRQNGRATPLFDRKQGTIEFWIKKLWDDRLRPLRSGPLLTNGFAHVPIPSKLPLNEWAHVAVVWRPAKRDPSVTLVHLYVDGLDTAYYRSIWWPGYPNRTIRFDQQAELLGEFVSRLTGGAQFAIDELRVSSVARYADLDVEFGHRQTFNPVRFQSPQKSFTTDADTSLLLHFDGDLKSTANQVEARLAK